MEEEKKSNKKITVIDVEGAVLGRAASIISKRLLKGEAIDVVNAEKALISENSGRDYSERFTRGGRDWGPYFPKRADLIFRRTVRGMVPWQITRGRKAMEAFRAYLGIPAKHEGAKAERLDKAIPSGEKVHPYLPLGDYTRKAFEGKR